jgi:hypothetical protein
MRVLIVCLLLALVDLSFVSAGCRATKIDAGAEAPPPVHVESEDYSVIQVAHPEDFPLATAIEILPASRSAQTVAVDSDVKEMYAAIPATAVLRMHGRNWVYVPARENSFRRVDILAGALLPGNMREVLFGIKPGDQVVKNALVFQSTVEQK